MNRVRKITFFRKYSKYKILNPAFANVLTKAVTFNQIFITILNSNRDPPNHNNARSLFLDHCRLPALNEMLNKFAKGFLQRLGVL